VGQFGEKIVSDQSDFSGVAVPRGVHELSPIKDLVGREELQSH
jgi:hypothetical protein